MATEKGSKIVVEIMPDGSLKTDASSTVGSEADIMELLEDLAREMGGKLEVEKHVETHHHHHHHKGGHHHHHKGKGKG